jgi:ADP-ribose 1''-phosphate phosphatase
MNRRRIYVGFATEQPRIYVGLSSHTSFHDENEEQTHNTITSRGGGKSSDIISSSSYDTAGSRIYIRIEESIGNILDAPDNSIIIHMCNSTREWSVGIGIKYGLSYPRAHEIYNNYRSNTGILGTCMIIPPSEKQGPKHYIACLFTHDCTTSRNEPCSNIEDNIKSAVSDMVYRISILESRISQVRICKVWSSNCKLPWKVTRNIIASTSVPEALTINVIDNA